MVMPYRLVTAKLPTH